MSKEEEIQVEAAGSFEKHLIPGTPTVAVHVLVGYLAFVCSFCDRKRGKLNRSERLQEDCK